MFVIATDLDRTLIPNGNQPYDKSMPIFTRIVNEYSSALIYVTGRDLALTQEGMRKYGLPEPDYLVGEVGTKIYAYTDGGFSEDLQWIDELHKRTGGWDIDKFRSLLKKLPGLRMQEEERQNAFKLSYYIDDLSQSASLADSAREAVQSVCPNATIVYSVDETLGQGLLDILPRYGTKSDGLEYIRKKRKYDFDDVIYSGDSGNDLNPLTHGYWAILVANAIDEVREKAQQMCKEKNLSDRLYIAQGLGRLNGNYVSGIIEGLIHFGRIDKSFSV